MPEKGALMKHQIIFALCSLTILVGVGVFAFQNLEGWKPLDTIYCSAMSFMTLGCSITPATTNGKIFSIFYYLFGIAIMLFALTTIGTHWVESRIKIIGSLLQSPLAKIKGFNENGKISDKIIDGILFDRKK